MTAHAGSAPTGGARTAVSRFSRIYGLGSVYAKSLRDSRLAVIIVGGLVGIMLIVTGVSFGQAYATEQSRQELANLVKSLPAAMAGVYGTPFPVNMTSLGGSINFKTGPSMGLMVALWSILALSGTLAGEIRRGSLEFVAATPLGMRRIALEKLAAHLTGMAIVVVVTAVSALAAGFFATLPGDEITPSMAVGYAAWIGVVGLASGSVAFALAPLVGRGASAGIAGAVLLVGYFANGYQAAVPAFAPLANVTWWGWTEHHQPLAGQFDWVSLLPGAIVAGLLFAVGVAVFTRRDLGVTVHMPWPSMPRVALGLGGPAARSFGERLPLAFWWGIGVGLMGFIFGATALSFSTSLVQQSPDIIAVFKAVFPDIDLASGSGAFLEIAFVTFGFILAGFAAATLVNGWAADETDNRLEMLLATPMSRVRWVLQSGLGLYGAIAVFTAMLVVGVGFGSILTGGDVLTPILGTLVIGLYALALAGIGIAFGGVFGTSLAGEVVAAVVILAFLVDFLVPALELPGWIRQLALTAHLGQPMVGVWDWVGMAGCVVIAAGGLLLSAWGIARRDVAR
jgi:ABC-2 type transport system permease protein